MCAYVYERVRTWNGGAVMAKPIHEAPVLKGKAAKAFSDYLKSAPLDPQAAVQRAKTRKVFAQSKKIKSKAQ